MTQDEIIEMARQVGIKRRTDVFYSEFCDGVYADDLEAFAKLVAKHTLMNIDPSKFMSHQESIEAGRFAEREACAELRNKFHPFDLKGRQEIIGVMNTALDDYQAAIRARGME
jgi:hypothetical protein